MQDQSDPHRRCHRAVPTALARAPQVVFIRAPAITRIGTDVDVLCSLDKKLVGLDEVGGQLAVAVQQKNILGIAFHPGAGTRTSPRISRLGSSTRTDLNSERPYALVFSSPPFD